MRTTLVLDDALLREARRRAADRDLTLSDVVNEALREALHRDPRPAPPFSMITYGQADRTVTHDPADFADAVEADDRSALAR